MIKVVDDDEVFTQWIHEFLPQLQDPDFVLEPGEVDPCCHH